MDIFGCLAEGWGVNKKALNIDVQEIEEYMNFKSTKVLSHMYKR
jgi:hypothetical protein